MAVNVDPDHHVARYCGHQKISQTIPPMATAFAFELRLAAPGRDAETYLSVNHCEHHAGSRLDQLRAILGDLTAKNFTWKKSGGFAVLNAGKVVECGKSRDRSLRVRRRKHEQDVSYASIEGVPMDNADLELLELLAHDASVEFHIVGNIP